MTLNYTDKLNDKNYNEDNIYLFTQFYISSNKQRQNEIITCLKKNIELNVFSKIYLISERTYTQEELELNDEEIKSIQQIVFEKNNRMTYLHPMCTVKSLKLNGYIVIANSDIFFDNTIINLRKTSLSQIKSFYALLRFEYKHESDLNKCKLLGPRGDSQDTWILHSKYLPNDLQIAKCNFALGKPGCDNSIAYLFHTFGFKVFNEPYLVKTYHYHTSSFRTYTVRDRINPPYLFLNPVIRK
jgi:hypothetical protein